MLVLPSPLQARLPLFWFEYLGLLFISLSITLPIPVPYKRQSVFSEQVPQKKDCKSIIWCYFQWSLCSRMTWSHTEAKASAAIILSPHSMSLLVTFSWSALSTAATAIAGDNCSPGKPRDPRLSKCAKHPQILSSIQPLILAKLWDLQKLNLMIFFFIALWEHVQFY